MRIARVHDLTLPLTERTVRFPGDPAPRLDRIASISTGDAMNHSILTTGCHVGTHLDAPLHFLEAGSDTESFAVERLVGQASVIDLTGVANITAESLRTVSLPSGRHLLLKSRNGPMLGEADFRHDYAVLTPDGADLLIESEPLSVGIDYYSLDPADSTTFPAHRKLAEANVPVCVCLDLREVSPGEYFYACLPLRLPAAEGAPVRAVLIEFAEQP